MVVPAFEFPRPPRLGSGDNVRGFVIGERLGVDEPERLNREQHEEETRDQAEARLGFGGDGGNPDEANDRIIAST